MKFSISSGELLSRLQTMGKIIEDKSTVPAYANFLFSVTGNTLVLTAANNEMRIVSSIEINNMEGADGRICIPGPKLTEYIKYLPEQPVTFSIPEGTLTLSIQSLSGESTQNCVSANDYPDEQNIEGEVKSFKIAEEALLTGISSTIFATSDDELRPIMNGVFFDVEPGKVSFVATDTHKLVRYIRFDVETGDMAASFILNKKPANVLKGILSKSDAMVSVSFSDKNVIFESATYRYYCRLTDGVYPQYKSVIPENNEARIVVNRNDFIKAAQRAAVFVDATQLVKCEIFSNSIQISTQDLDFSCSAKEVIPCEYNGPDMSIGFSGVHMKEALNNVDAQDVEIRLSDPSKPALISPTENSQNSDMLMVVMPMRV